MGQSQTTTKPPPPTLTKTQALYAVLAKTLPPLTLQDYESIFASLAEHDDEGGVYWKEDTLARFLEVPAEIGSLVFKSASYLAALPTLEGVPAVLTKEELGVAVMVYSQRVPTQVLSTREVSRLLFNSFAEIQPRQLGNKEKTSQNEKDAPMEKKSTTGTYGPQISVETMTKLISFLLTITTSSPVSTSETTVETLTPKNKGHSLKIAESMIAAIQSYAKSPSDLITYDSFRAFYERDAPFFFDPLVPLFQRFLFDQQKWGNKPAEDDFMGALQSEKTTDLMTLPVLAQISMFLPKERRLGKLVLLYAGSRDGFSMGMFESKVLKYPGPTMLLVRGTLPNPDPTQVLFGAYISLPWKSSAKENFGDKQSLLFQLSPLHTLYPSAPYHTQFVYFHPRIGLGFGCAPPQHPHHHPRLTNEAILRHTSDAQVSLSLDPSFEEGVFTHVLPGGTFVGNPVRGDGSLRFDVDDVEVWGCGVDKAREEQRRAWEWERKEAERRQSVRIREDLAGDKALLEMAGLIGQNRSGGSI